MRGVYASIAITMLLVIWSASNIMWGKHHAGIIKADGKGYYAHLPALFIHSDVNFGFFDSLEGGKYFNKNYYYDYRKQFAGKTLNKYYCGTAVPMAPFFAGAHLYAKKSSHEADGFSMPYNISISIAAIFYLLASLLVFVQILKHFKIRNTWIALTIPLIVFGTNWYYYVVSEPAVSHVYSVFFISLFLLLGLRWAETGRLRIVAMGFLLGLIVLIRPVNGLVILLLPFFFDRWQFFWRALKIVFREQTGRVLVGVFVGLVVISLQFWLYYTQTGHFFIYSYEDEGFNFLKPEIFNILFSYKKGFFVYTPLALVSLVGVFFMFKRNRLQPTWLLLFLAVLTYVLSSWWNWYYGGSFSSRVYLDYIVLFAIPLAFLLNGISVKWLRTSMVTVLVLLALFCQFQTYQYRKMIIHWDGLTKERYWEIFLDYEGLK